MFAQEGIRFDGPASVARYDIAEFTVTIAQPRFANPFTDVELNAEFRGPDKRVAHVTGFCDSSDGSVFRLRFSPFVADAMYAYTVRLRASGLERMFKGELRSTASSAPGPVIVDPDHPKHFRYAGSGRGFYHVGYTAYHLLDPSRSDAQVDATIDYCARLGFNKIRFLLTGYPRDTAVRTSSDTEHGVPDAGKRWNYGALPDRMNPLPAWVGQPHSYDFSRFHLPHWKRVDRAIAKMRERGIVATAIITIEKQNLPQEYGRLTPAELRLYRYAAARLSAFDNVWFDLGNEHNEFRDTAWGDAMGHLLKAWDPHARLKSAHAYAEFAYSNSGWADYIITQQYGDEQKVYQWARKYADVPKPYVNEEYGYEGPLDKPGHLQSADWTRRLHWTIAMAGGYASYGDWSNGVAYFYMGDPGPGVAATQLRHLRTFFEALPFARMSPCGASTSWMCAGLAPELYVYFFPSGVASAIDVPAASETRWYDPRTGRWTPASVSQGRADVSPPTAQDWVLLIRK
jgi:hypothetical protein